MLPETKRSNNVLLYEAENFPYGWKVVDTLIHNVRYKDPSIYLSDTLNILVVVDDDSRGYVYWSDSLFGNWVLQEKPSLRWGNETRPGGRIFSINQELFIPFQNFSKGYGTGLSLYKIISRNKSDIQFQKLVHFFLGPYEPIKWFNRGMHHIDVQEIDDQYHIFYDGDRRNGKTRFQYRGTVKGNLMDLHQFLMN